MGMKFLKIEAMSEDYFIDEGRRTIVDIQFLRLQGGLFMWRTERQSFTSNKTKQTN